MIAHQRRKKIVDMIKEDGSVRVSQLSTIFRISEQTIRQDLTKIEQDGEIVRDHGGAYLKNFTTSVRTMTLEHQENMALKIRIGKKATEFIKTPSTIILDSGSTVSELAKNLSGYKDLRIITNSLNIALLLGAEPAIEIIMTGGDFKAPTLSLTGNRAADFFSGLHADQLFLATAGILLNQGLTYPSFSDIPVKQAMIDTAREVYLLADSTKINNRSFITLDALHRIDFLITDNGISEENILTLENLGIEIIIA